MFGAGLCSPNPRGVSSQWVQVAGTAGTDGPSAGPSTSSHTPVWKVALAWPHRAASWRKLKASAGIGSPEDGAKLPQRCGWGERGCGWGERGGLPGGVPWLSSGWGSPIRPALASWDSCPTALSFFLSEHLRGLRPGADSPPGGIPGKRREGRPGYPRRTRPGQLCPGRRLGSGVAWCGESTRLPRLTEGLLLSPPVLRRAGAPKS